MTPRVSAIVPNFNYASYLGQRLDSILKQSVTDLELLLLDDASTDASRGVWTPYTRDPRVRVFTQEQNSGNPFQQWNAGAARAAGEFLWFAEADDYAAPLFLERLLAALDAAPNAALAYCQSIAVDAKGTALRRLDTRTRNLDPERWTQDFTMSGRAFCERYLLVKNVVPNASAVVVRRAAFEASGGAVQHFRLSGDWITWAQVALEGDVCFVAEPLNYFRRHPGSVRGAAEREGLQTLEAYRVVSHLRERLGWSRARIGPVYQRLFRKWIRRSLRRRARIPLRTHPAIWRAARSVDPDLRRRPLWALLGRTS